MSLDPNDLPQIFGQYTLLKRIAVGGMAEVYVAKSGGVAGFEKLVALKVIHPRYSEDEHFTQMLVEEAKISVILTHVNIVQTFDLGRVDDTYYIAMELIEGADAYRVMRRCAELKKALPIDVATFIAAEMCNGLDYAHRKHDPETGRPLHIVHRDISPQNVLLSTAGEVKIVDFGIAKAASRTNHTEVGVIKGKYYYMSPEQAWGDPIDQTSDVFSTGVVLYELLTGRMLYQDTDIPTLIDKVRKAEIPRPETRRPNIPRALSDVVMKALARRPEDRYRSAGEMGQALHQVLYSISSTFSSTKLARLVTLLFPPETGVAPSTEMPLDALESEPPARPAPAAFELGDDDDDDATRNDVLPFRRQLAAEARARAAAAAERREEGAGGPPIAAPRAVGSSAPSVHADDVDDYDEPTLVDEQVIRAGRDALRARAELERRAREEAPRIAPPALAPSPVAYAEAPRVAPPRQGPPSPHAEPIRLERPVRGTGRLGAVGLPAPAPAPAPAPLRSPVGPPVGPPLPPMGHAPRGVEQPFVASPYPWSVSQRPPPPAQPIPNFAQVPFPSAEPPPPQVPGLDPFTASDFHVASHDAPERASKAPWGIFAVLLLVLAVAAGGLVYLFVPPPPPTFEISSLPAGAAVTVDGTPVGQAPLVLRDGLIEGRAYAFQVSLEGYESATFELVAKPGVDRHEVILSPTSAILHVETVPTGAQVEVGGAARGRAPVDIGGLFVGSEVEVRVDAPGYLPRSVRVRIPASRHAETIQLEAMR